VFFALLILGLTGYKLDGNLLRFLVELFKVSRAEVSKKEKASKTEKPK